MPLLKKIGSGSKKGLDQDGYSKLKAHLRRIGARTFSDLFAAIGEVCDLFTPDECWNYLVNSGYAST